MCLKILLSFYVSILPRTNIKAMSADKPKLEKNTYSSVNKSKIISYFPIYKVDFT